MPVTFAPGPHPTGQHPTSPPRSHRRLSPSSPSGHGRVMTSLRPTHYVQPPASRRSRTRASFSSDRSEPPTPPEHHQDPGSLLAAVQDSTCGSAQETNMHSSTRAWHDPERLPLLAEANEDEPPRQARSIVWRIVAATSATVLVVTGILLWTANTIWPWEQPSIPSSSA